MRLWLAIFALLGGCGGAVAPEPKAYDFGIDAPAASLPPVRLTSVRAAAPFESVDMHYRLAYRNAAEIAAFAGSRWAATPPEMLRKQLLRAVVEGGAKCSLAVEIQEFSQVFASASQSAARVELRVVLAAGARSMARGISVVEEQAGADAPGGAAALARAVNRAIGELGGWIGAQPDCR